MNPISDTAYYCAGTRMQDAESGNPICGDNYARCFMDEHGLAVLARFEQLEQHRIANLVRHRIIDELLQRELKNDPRTTVLVYGAGFDARAFRFNSGNWIEVDEPQIIDYKNARLPQDRCQNRLARIAHRFDVDDLAGALSGHIGAARIIVVVEGVLRYLELKAVTDLVATLQRLLPEHDLICDLMSRAFSETVANGSSEIINGLGASFRFLEEEPETVFSGGGYRLIEKISVAGYAVDSGFMKISGDSSTFDQDLIVNGYSICRFSYP